MGRCNRRIISGMITSKADLRRWGQLVNVIEFTTSIKMCVKGNSAVAPTTNMAPYNTYILSIIINCDLYTKTIKYHYIRVITAFAFILKSSVFCDYVQNQAKIARRCARPYGFRMVLLGRIICDLPSSVNKFRYRISTNIE